MQCRIVVAASKLGGIMRMECHRTAVIVAWLILSNVAAWAGPRDDALEAVGRCAGVTDAQARLACYDAAAPRLKQALGTPPTSLDHAPTKAEQESWFGFDLGDLFGGGSSAPSTPEQFGKERTVEAQAERAVEEQRGIDSISAGVTEFAYTPFGQFIVFLDNGQVWRQLQGDADRAHFKSNARDNRVTVSRGALGSYNLSINGSGKIYKVTRVK
jgi:hypothetical protein